MFNRSGDSLEATATPLLMIAKQRATANITLRLNIHSAPNNKNYTQGYATLKSIGHIQNKVRDISHLNLSSAIEERTQNQVQKEALNSGTQQQHSQKSKKWRKLTPKARKIYTILIVFSTENIKNAAFSTEKRHL
ncbi:MAG: hypothetical protein MI867_06535 [Pseudomonadales bacterium]|nr:hypothetical protein [Pseudomonadales bacterium]